MSRIGKKPVAVPAGVTAVIDTGLARDAQASRGVVAGNHDDAHAGGLRWNDPAWSISAELAAYLLFPAIAIAAM